jgi:8-oxo-dGTP diphosphatase
MTSNGVVAQAGRARCNALESSQTATAVRAARETTPCYIVPMSAPRLSAAVLYSVGDRVLLRLRDDRADLPYPNHWDLIGGAVEHGETIHEAVLREIKEEIDLQGVGLEYFSNYPASSINHVFTAPLAVPVENLVLTEGQRLALVTQEQARTLALVPWVATLLDEYFAARR